MINSLFQRNMIIVDKEIIGWIHGGELVWFCLQLKYRNLIAEGQKLPPSISKSKVTFLILWDHIDIWIYLQQLLLKQTYGNDYQVAK